MLGIDITGDIVDVGISSLSQSNSTMDRFTWNFWLCKRLARKIVLFWNHTAFSMRSCPILLLIDFWSLLLVVCRMCVIRREIARKLSSLLESPFLKIKTTEASCSESSNFPVQSVSVTCVNMVYPNLWSYLPWLSIIYDSGCLVVLSPLITPTAPPRTANWNKLLKWETKLPWAVRDFFCLWGTTADITDRTDRGLLSSLTCSSTMPTPNTQGHSMWCISDLCKAASWRLSGAERPQPSHEGNNKDWSPGTCLWKQPVQQEQAQR